VGVWKVDPAALDRKAQAAFDVTVNFQTDRQFVMAVNPQFSLKGTWSFADNKLTMSPTTLAMKSPYEPSKMLEVPLGPAIANAEKTNSDPKMLDAMKSLSGSTIYDVSADGKKLSENGRPALVKSS